MCWVEYLARTGTLHVFNESFVNRNIRRRGNVTALLLVNELADGELQMLLKRPNLHIWTHHLVESCMFQVAAALFALERYFQARHNDLHYGNVLVHKVKPGGYWKYVINEKAYFVPNCGYMFVLWDFGLAHIPGKIGRLARGADTTQMTDIARIAYIIDDMLYRNLHLTQLGGQMNDILETLTKVSEYDCLGSVIKKEFRHFTLERPPQNQILATYNMTATSVKDVKDSVEDTIQHLVPA
ncbi:hypothetical protein HDU81_009385 [Chytriomyces hyalinus]|nr:hypothetical protein HDU81_009385 [Chytriomyces hyalinus]